MTMNEDLKRERAQATFSVEQITNVIDGGKAVTERRRHIEKVISLDPTGVFDNTDNPYLHRTDRHIRASAKHVRMIEICRKLGIGDNNGGQIILDKDFHLMMHAIGDDLNTALHWIMFVPNIMSLCDDDQQSHWMPLIRDWKIMGCYAQTELGHGSNIRALETTATFVPESKGGLPGGSFIINSPTLTSTKFWPGSLGCTANHAVVIARLIDGDGVDKGIHSFIVPLRSMKDHTWLPGVKTGDIGPKIGLNNMDNGFAQFDNVVIPRRNMAMRFSSVDESGKYQKKSVSDAASKISYVTMMLVRALIIFDSSTNLSKACTISIRYSAVRRQGYTADEETEQQVLNYRQQQHRLFPLLASSYGFFFAGRRVQNRLFDLEKRISSNLPVRKEQMADLHATLSSLKSYTTTIAADGIEDCRKACGGHGFLQSSGLPELSTTYLQNPTVEGDNQMLPQHVVKVLLKLVSKIQNGEDTSGYKGCDSAYLIGTMKAMIDSEPLKKCDATSEKDMQSLPLLLDAFNHRVSRLLVEVAKSIQDSVMAGTKTPYDAWNDNLIQMARVSRAYSQFLVIMDFHYGIEEEKNNGSLGSAEYTVMCHLAILCGLYWMEKDLGDFLEDGYISSKQSTWMRASVLTLIDLIRPNAVALVDARDYSDFRLKSALGRYDGDVYPAILAASKRDPLNAKEIGPSYNPHLKKLYVDGVGVYSGTAARL